MASRLETAYQSAEKLAQTHYENFPVGSFLLPRKLRRPIQVIYAFARSADDIADEGNLTKGERLEQLNFYWQTLEMMENNGRGNIIKNSQSYPSQTSVMDSVPPLFLALQSVIETHKLPYSLFFDLLKAFKQDVTKSDYKSHEEILQYCHYSANPIGRLLLHLTNNDSPENMAASDSICTALQLINFIQDLQSDLRLRDRCYFPLDEMQRFNIIKNDLLLGKNSSQISAFIHQQTLLAQALLEKGSILGSSLTGLFGLEIRLIISAANQITQQLLKRKSVYERPTIKFWHWPKILLKGLMDN